MTLPYVLEPMRRSDLDEVLRIEHASFPRPWPVQAFLSELALPYTYYIVARLSEGQVKVRELSNRRARWSAWRNKDRKPSSDKPSIIGYAGLQVILDEGHVMTLAVHPDFRRRGVAELLLLDLFEQGRRRGALHLTLEVRPSNRIAQSLYRKYGFSIKGRRPHYYSDGEEALIMWTDRLDTEESQSALEKLRGRLLERLSHPMPAQEETCDPDTGPGDIL